MPLKQIVSWIFYGNYFYGLCIVALSIEAALQQRYPLNSSLYHAIVFLVTVLYYTTAYLPGKHAREGHNRRSNWYIRNRSIIGLTYVAGWILLAGIVAVYVSDNLEGLLRLQSTDLFLLTVFPAFALLYYGVEHHLFGRLSLRSIGWLKPFLIGGIWAGVATVYPVIFHEIESGGDGYQFNIVGTFLFIKNLMYITVLCIMFDIKDYAEDYNRQIKTFVVRNGLRHTIFRVLLPLTASGLAAFLVYAIDRQFSNLKIAINLVPFVALIVVAYSLHRRQSILYYLAAIDGLMLLKGICGTIAMTFF